MPGRSCLTESISALHLLEHQSSSYFQDTPRETKHEDIPTLCCGGVFGLVFAEASLSGPSSGRRCDYTCELARLLFVARLVLIGLARTSPPKATVSNTQDRSPFVLLDQKRKLFPNTTLSSYYIDTNRLYIRHARKWLSVWPSRVSRQVTGD